MKHRPASTSVADVTVQTMQLHPLNELSLEQAAVVISPVIVGRL